MDLPDHPYSATLRRPQRARHPQPVCEAGSAGCSADPGSVQLWRA